MALTKKQWATIREMVGGFAMLLLLAGVFYALLVLYAAKTGHFVDFGGDRG